MPTATITSKPTFHKLNKIHLSQEEHPSEIVLSDDNEPDNLKDNVSSRKKLEQPDEIE